MNERIHAELLDRFCRYARVNTQAREGADTYPSTPGQLDLGRMLAEELRALGLADAEIDRHGIVMSTVPPTVPHRVPVVAWVAHVDTSPETSGAGVKPVVHCNYDGGDIVLSGDLSKVIRAADNPELTACRGKTIVTSDGTTLLGADDKSGVAVVMQAAAHLLSHRDIPHGPIRVCFTCDEEVGHGVDKLDLAKLGAQVAYTLDGGPLGELNGETFSADLAVVTVTGVNTHPAYAKDKMVNAVRLAAAFIDRMPKSELSPETTADRQGFLHPYRIEGGVAEVTIRVLLRDFETVKLGDKAKLLQSIARDMMAQEPRARIEVKVTPQYRNMADGLKSEPRALRFAEEAMRRAGVTPKPTIIRGGTDGSRLTELGLPTPNIFAGEHNIHSPLEWTCVEEMGQAVAVLVELAKLWGAERS